MTVKRQQFDFNINPQGTVFQQKIWRLVGQLSPLGERSPIIKVARSYGNAKAVRAVAAAIGKKSYLSLLFLAVVLLGVMEVFVGYSGGIDRKRKLLQLEGYPMQNIINLISSVVDGNHTYEKISNVTSLESLLLSFLLLYISPYTFLLIAAQKLV